MCGLLECLAGGSGGIILVVGGIICTAPFFNRNPCTCSEDLCGYRASARSRGKTAHTKLSWMCSADETQTLVIGNTGLVPWLSWVTEGASAPVGLGGSHGLVGRLCSTRWGFVGGAILCQTRALRSLSLVTSSSQVALPCSRAPGAGAKKHGKLWAPTGLPVLYHLFEMNSHFIHDCILLEGHDGKVSVNKGHGGHAFIDHGSTLGCEHQIHKAFSQLLYQQF